jgi:CHAT domain-containing protein/Tfp pilus assembly protein PilF
VPLKEELTPEQRQKLMKEAQALHRQGLERYQQSRLEEAANLMEQALRMCRRLYPPDRYPAGHPDLARGLSWQGFLLQRRGELGQAEPYFRQALAMHQKLYPKERYPDGHPELARGLINLGSLLQDRSELAQADPLYREALAMCQKLYPKERYPNGHPDLADSLYYVGTLLQARGELAQAEPFLRRALAMRQKLYPAERLPEGHPDLAASLSKLGFLLRTRGELAQAEPFLRQALAMDQKLYPAERLPDGHPDLAQSLYHLGSLLQDRGELAQAEPYLRLALAMYHKLYPGARFPKGHPDLAASLTNLGNLLQDRGKLAQAEPYFRRALAMWQKLYPAARFPEGHPYLATCLNNLGSLLHTRGELAQAETYLRQALAMRQKLYAKARFPDGHPELAGSLNNLGRLLQARGELAQAEPYLRQALAICQKLYDTARFPDGHPHLAASLTNLGHLFHARGEPAMAEPYLRHAVATYQRLLNALLAGSAEVEALNFLAQAPYSRDLYLSVTARCTDKAEDAYGALWHSKGAVAHMLQQRRRALLLANDLSCRDLAKELTTARQTLANLLRPDANPRPNRVRELSDLKEKLEKQLADKLPLYKALRERLQRGPADLLPFLPADTVLCDLVCYQRNTHNPCVPGREGESRKLCYLAFVLAKGQPLSRVELGAAEPIDQALAAWRRSLQAGRANGPAADALRRLLWRPMETTFPPGTRTVILAPDAGLTGLPWAALPGRQPGRLLLEQYALATIPDGQLLLDLLVSPPVKGTADILLAAAGIDYDQPAAAVAPAPVAKGLARAPQPGKERHLWSALPATAQELAQLERLAGKRTIVRRQGTAASTGQLLTDLPRARWAHLATHGFFADPSVRSIFQLSPEDYQRSQRGERIGLGARSPLVLSGLVCAGANRPVKDPEKEDGGILTAEAIAGLDLEGLELAVLSACDTGLGEVAGGEGVFGLQRAFHLAGARTVVASLWKIDDDATQALMAEFYRNLWERKLPKLEALRRAQLAMLLHYDAKAGRLRAPGAPVPVDPAELAAAREKVRASGRPPLPPLYWAGFVLSGDWR